MIKFTVRLKPVTKKNSQQIMTNNTTGKHFIAPSKTYKDYEEAAMWFIPKLRQIEPINYPVNIKCLFYMPTKQRCDLTNLLEAIDDVMVKAGLLADDNYRIIESHDGSRVLYDKKNPRTEVEITPISKGKNAFIHIVDETQPEKWISVEDRLPECETEVFVLAVSSNGNKTVTTAIYEDGKMPEDESHWSWEDVEMDYNEETDQYILPCGWWEYRHYGECLNFAVDDKVTHWMPIPEPPKEGD